MYSLFSSISCHFPFTSNPRTTNASLLSLFYYRRFPILLSEFWLILFFLDSFVLQELYTHIQNIFSLFRWTTLNPICSKRSQTRLKFIHFHGHLGDKKKKYRRKYELCVETFEASHQKAFRVYNLLEIFGQKKASYFWKFCSHVHNM